MASHDQPMQRSLERRKKEIALSINDGIALSLVKRASLLDYWYHNHLLCPRILPRLFPLAERLLKKYPDFTGHPLAEQQDMAWRMAIDFYTALWFLALCALYFLCYVVLLVAKSYRWPCTILLAGAFLLAIWRLYEVLSFIAGLHSNPEYWSAAKIRTVINTFWHYVEIVLVFAVMYLAVSYWGDPFRGSSGEANPPSPLYQGVLDPIYFSSATITTIGYGDFSPQTPLGKGLVMLEVFAGLFLLVVVIQRTISASQLAPGPPRRRPKRQRPRRRPP